MHEDIFLSRGSRKKKYATTIIRCLDVGLIERQAIRTWQSSCTQLASISSRMGRVVGKVYGLHVAVK